MKQKIRIYLLVIYDLFLAFGAIYYGFAMIGSKEGIFAEYPKEWLTKLPFTSWIIPGTIAIVFFGFGNITAAVCCLINLKNKAWLVSLIMGGTFFFSLIAQIIILGESYLATDIFLLMSIIQLTLSIYVLRGGRIRFMDHLKG
jgi:hypothetical protein